MFAATAFGFTSLNVACQKLLISTPPSLTCGKGIVDCTFPGIIEKGAVGAVWQYDAVSIAINNGRNLGCMRATSKTRVPMGRYKSKWKAKALELEMQSLHGRRRE
jgi:hypothetical protein